MAGHRKWTDEDDRTIRECISEGASTCELGRMLGCSATAIQKRMKKLGVQPRRQGKPPSVRPGARPEGKLKPAPKKTFSEPPHIAQLKAVRRGFVVPPNLEERYLELLKSGVSIAEARRQLGI